LSLSLVIVGFKFVESQSLRKELQNSIDSSFRYQLSNVLGSFSMEVNDYTYRTMISSVSNVAAMSELTSFEEINDNLDISLNYLYISLREEKSKDKVLLRIEELREIFNIMVQDPVNHEATDRIIQITNETFFNTKE
jgi:aspartyl-tRNA synthetase